MRKLVSGLSWPTPEEWQQLLGPSSLASLEADAAEIIARGPIAINDMGATFTRKKKKESE